MKLINLAYLCVFLSFGLQADDRLKLNHDPLIYGPRPIPPPTSSLNDIQTRSVDSEPNLKPIRQPDEDRRIRDMENRIQRLERCKNLPSNYDRRYSGC